MKIIFHPRCRSLRDVLIFLLSFSVLSLYVTYQLGTLSVSRTGSSDAYIHVWGSRLRLGDGYFLDQEAVDEDGKVSRTRDGSGAIGPSVLASGTIRKKVRQILKQVEDQQRRLLRNVSKVALVHGAPRVIHRDLPLYQEVLLRHQFTVKVPSYLPNFASPAVLRNSTGSTPSNDGPLSSSFSRSLLSDWWVMFCMTTLGEEDEGCLPQDWFSYLGSYQKINRILGIRSLLWSPEGLCATLNDARQLPVLRRRFIAPMCFLLPEQYERFISVADALGDDVRWILKPLEAGVQRELLPVMDHKMQSLLKQYDQNHPVILQQFFPNPLLIFGSPVSLRVYVLLTSILPLRAHLFNEGLVHFRYDQFAGFQKVPGRLWMMSQLWHHIAQNYGHDAMLATVSNVQRTIVDTLLFSESKLVIHFASLSSNRSKIKYRCQHCFQLLAFEIVFNSSLHPVILDVDGHPPMQEMSKEDGWTGNRVKRSLLGSLLELLFGTESVAEEVAETLESESGSVGVMGVDCMLFHELCLTEEDLRYLLDSRREAKSGNGFRQVYPSSGMERHNELLDELDGALRSQKPSAVLIDKVLSRLSSRHNTAELHPLLAALERRYALQEGRDGDIPSNSWSDAGDGITSSFFSDLVYRSVRPPDGVPKPDWDGRPLCSDDSSTLPYISSLHVEPALNVSPPFSPAVMDYFASVSYDQLMVRVWAYALNCQSEARLDEKFGTSQPANYTLGLGDNRISFLVVDIRHTEPWVINTYTLTIHRHSVLDGEVAIDLTTVPHEVCGIKQDCQLQISPTEPCGLQKDAATDWTEFLASSKSLPFCTQGDASGRWVLPCRSCTLRHTCLWSKAVWAPLRCRHGFVDQAQLSKCLTGKKVLFIGDSTNRGIMHYLMERLNGTLTEWDKTHHLKVYTNVNGGRTTVSFAYYPQFWLPTNERPVFEKALYQLVQKSRPLRNDSQTILIVGGVHWLATQHLHMLLRALKREGLEGIRLIMKTLGSGFHLPVEGVHTLSKGDQKKLLLHSMGLADFARHYNFEVIDTFNITAPRFKDFLQGKCACHFHKVVPLETSEDVIAAGQSATFADQPWFLAPPRGGADGGRSYRYHVEGPVNAAYSEILISRLCHEYREGTGGVGTASPHDLSLGIDVNDDDGDT